MKKWIKNNLRTILIPVAGLTVIGTSVITSHYDCQGEEYLTGNVVDKSERCNPLIKYLNVGETYKTKCTGTLMIDTSEGRYAVGVLGSLDERIGIGTDAKFVKKNMHWVTKFKENNMGLLPADKIENLVEK